MYLYLIILIFASCYYNKNFEIIFYYKDFRVIAYYKIKDYMHFT